MSTAAVTPDPYAAYGGKVSVGSGADPYASYGGKVVTPVRSEDKSKQEQKGALQSFADASGISAIAHPIDTIMGIPSAVKGMVNNTVDNVKQGVSDYQKEGLTDKTRRDFGRAVPIVGPALAEAQAQHDAGNNAGMAGTLAGTVAGLAGPKVLKEGGELIPGAVQATGGIAEDLGEAIQNKALNRINKTVGSLQQDFQHGSNPARGYVSQNMGTSASMASIAQKAETASSEVGSRLSFAYKQADATASLIPVDTVAKALAKPIKDAHDLESGAFGGGKTGPLEDYAQRIVPSLQEAQAKGGFTPSELFELKQRLTKNINWKSTDPLETTLNSVREEQYGGLASILSDAVPETKGLNQAYGDLKALQKRTALRSLTGSQPLTNFKEQSLAAGAGSAIGSGVGAAIGGPIGAGAGAVVGGGIGLAADSIPAKTAVASGLYRAGGTLREAGSRLSGSNLSEASELGDNSGNPLNGGNSDEGRNGNGNNKKQLPPPSTNSNATPSQPTQQSQLSPLPRISQLPGGPQGWRLSSASEVPTAAPQAPPSPPPPFNPGTARTRIKPLMPSRPTVIPPRGAIAVSPSGEATLPAKGLPAPEATAKPLTGKALWTERGTQNLAAHGVSSDEIQNLAKTTKGKDLLVIASGLTPGSAAMKNLVKQIKALNQ